MALKAHSYAVRRASHIFVCITALGAATCRKPYKVSKTCRRASTSNLNTERRREPSRQQRTMVGVRLVANFEGDQLDSSCSSYICQRLEKFHMEATSLESDSHISIYLFPLLGSWLAMVSNATSHDTENYLRRQGWLLSLGIKRRRPHMSMHS